MTPRNGFLTFCFAFVPGAGQMYQGYAKRGVSLCAAFFGLLWLASAALSSIGLLACIIWMYSFFDTFNLRAQILSQSAAPDDFIVHLPEDGSLGILLEKRHTLVGMGLVVLGVFAIYDNFVRGPLASVLNDWGLGRLADLVYDLPSLAVCIALILLGLWLVRGRQDAETAPSFAEPSPYDYRAETAPSAAGVGQPDIMQEENQDGNR